MAKKNSFVVRQIHVPFDKIYPVLNGQSSMQIQMIFEVAKEPFNAICSFRDRVGLTGNETCLAKLF